MSKNTKAGGTAGNREKQSDAVPDNKKNEDVCQVVSVTIFTDHSGKKFEQKDMPWAKFVEELKARPAHKTKDKKPLFKLATFGDVPNPESGCYRHNDNVKAVTGATGDLDNGRLSFDEAKERLEAANVKAVIATSFSHNGDAPRLRVAAPTSEPLPPEELERITARLNGILDGNAAPESFTLSQCYYLGGKVGGEYRVECTFDDPDEGYFIDDSSLDTINHIYKQGEKADPVAEKYEGGADFDGSLGGLRIRKSTRALIENGAEKGKRSEPMMTVINALVGAGLSDDGIIKIFEQYPIGEKYHEKGRHRERWLQPQINKARGRVPPPEPPPDHDLPPLDAYDAEPIDTPPEPPPQPKSARRFGFIHNNELEAKIPEWVVKWFIESDSIVQIFGDPGCGKSFIGLDIAACIATGKDFHGKQTKAGASYYIAAEGRNGIARRLKAWENRYQQPLMGWPLFISTGAGNLCDPESAAEIVDAIEGAGEPPAVIVVDTLARNFGPGDENSTKDMNMFIAALDRIRERYRCTIILIHHTGHGDKSRGRGAMALKGALDAEYRLDKDIYGVVRCEATKMKDAEIPEPMAFNIVSVEIGMVDEDGEPVTSAVLDSTDYKAPEKSSTGKGKHQAAAVKMLREIYDQHRQTLEEGGFCPSTARVAVDDWRAVCIDSGMNRTNFHRVKRSLADQGVIFIDHGFVTLS